MAKLESDELAIVTKLQTQIRKQNRKYTLLDRYFEGERRLTQIGLAVPPELRMFQAAVNVPRMAVAEPVSRQNLKGFQRRYSSTATNKATGGVDPELRDAWEQNNLTSQSMLLHQDVRLFGRGFVSVSANPDDDNMPIITVEPPEGLGIDVSPLGKSRAALRLYNDGPTQCGTLYLPDVTKWIRRGKNGWEEDPDIPPDRHKLGRLALVMFLNRQRTGRWDGVSEMADVIEKTDAIARLISNMQVAGEALAWPKRWAAGVSREEFVDKDGKPLPVWEAYMTVIMSTGNADAKFGNFQAAELKNFHDAVNALLAWCAAELGLPLRFMGQEAVNPASEGAIKADESRLVKNVEWKNRFDGDSWSWVMGLWERFRTNEWPTNNTIRALWFDPSTPTEAQLTDKVVKLKNEDILSREGAWDELNWDEARKDRERAYFAAQEADPYTQKVAERLAALDAAGQPA